MKRALKASLALALPATLVPATASAHSFGRLYNLPIPFWLYLYGAAAALLLSFLVIGYFSGAPEASAAAPPAQPHQYRWPRCLAALRVLSVAALLFTILCGFIGTGNAYYNFNMTWFWIVFVLGMTGLSALIGDLYAVINPWATLATLIPRQPRATPPRYPAALAYYPALLFYVAFIWLELFGHITPWSLSVALLMYTLVNLGGAWCYGPADWFRYGEFFGVLFRLIGKAAPVEIAEDGGARLRPPLTGLARQPAEHFSLLLFVLFMLASTAYDGLHDTLPWVNGFWVQLYHTLTPLLGNNIVQTYPLFKVLYAAYQYLGLLLSPLLYLALYLLCLDLMRRLTNTAVPLRQLALRFAFSLVPIGLVYNITHYFTLAWTQGPQILRLASDPFGYGWNLFGTARLLHLGTLPGMGLVWHTQVGLIVAGHVASIYLAHLEALRLFPTRSAAVVSQIPMLALMMAYTTIGLWILSEPITTAPTG